MENIYSSNQVGSTLNPPVDTTVMSYAELMSGYNEAIQKVETYRKTIDSLQLQNNMMTIQIGQLEEYLVDSFESIDEDTLQALAEIFDLDLTREVMVTLSAEIRMSIRLPLDKTVDDLDEFDFEISVDSSQYDIEFTDVVDVNVSE